MHFKSADLTYLISKVDAGQVSENVDREIKSVFSHQHREKRRPSFSSAETDLNFSGLLSMVYHQNSNECRIDIGPKSFIVSGKSKINEKPITII
jgi:hypothetical protein